MFGLEIMTAAMEAVEDKTIQMVELQMNLGSMWSNMEQHAGGTVRCTFNHSHMAGFPNHRFKQISRCDCGFSAKGGEVVQEERRGLVFLCGYLPVSPGTCWFSCGKPCRCLAVGINVFGHWTWHKQANKPTCFS